MARNISLVLKTLYSPVYKMHTHQICCSTRLVTQTVSRIYNLPLRHSPSQLPERSDPPTTNIVCQQVDSRNSRPKGKSQPKGSKSQYSYFRTKSLNQVLSFKVMCGCLTMTLTMWLKPKYVSPGSTLP